MYVCFSQGGYFGRADHGGIGNYNKMPHLVLFDKCLNYVQHSVPFKGIACKHFILNREAILGNHQCHQYLWLLILIIFWKTIFTQIIRFKGFKILSSDIVKQKGEVEVIFLFNKTECCLFNNTFQRQPLRSRFIVSLAAVANAKVHFQQFNGA